MGMSEEFDKYDMTDIYNIFANELAKGVYEIRINNDKAMIIKALSIIDAIKLAIVSQNEQEKKR